MNTVTRAYEATVDDVKPGERSVVSKINTDVIDRYRTVISPEGISLESYRKNPVVLWEHGKDPNRGTMPVGRNLWIKADAGRLIAKTVFRQDDYSQQLFEAYQDGGLRGWSVNILPRDSSPPTHDETRSRPHWAGADMIYRASELAEYSGTAVPGNPDTLTIMASRGIWISDEARTATETGSAALAVKPETLDNVERRVVEEGGKWYVLSEEGKRLGGPYGSKAEAEKRLAQVEAFKHMDKGRTFAVVHAEMLGLIRAWRDETKADLQALQDLYVRGRV